jgi:hypothetical protein
MSDHDLLTILGENIFDRIIEDTNPGDEFLLSIIDPDTFDKLKEEIGDSQQVENALKSTGRLYNVPDDYTAISVALLQASLIYFEINITDDSFYSKMKNYYPNLNENSDVQRYFEDIQEPLWGKVKSTFVREKRYLRIPQRKKGSGRYVQFPKSQQLIRWRELAEYADKFIKIKLEPGRILSLEDFCSMVHIEYMDDLSHEENEIIQKIVFSFYNKWDGRPSDEIRIKRFKAESETTLKHPEKEITISLNYEELCIYSSGHKISESELVKIFSDELVIPFVFDEDYQDWRYTNKVLQSNDGLLVLVNKSYKKYPDIFEKMKSDCLETNHFHVFIFKEIDNEISNFVKLDFDKKEIYTIIGGIKVNTKYNFVNNVLGCWYDSAFPKIKINLPLVTSVFIDSNEILVDKGQIDLSNLVLKEAKKKYPLPAGKHTLKCSGVSPAYFYIEECKANANIAINRGWIISSADLRPARNNEKPNIIGLKLLNSSGKTRKIYGHPISPTFHEVRLSLKATRISRVKVFWLNLAAY